jgi:hypothetical protein
VREPFTVGHKLAKQGHLVMQFLSEGHYIANKVDQKANFYSRKAERLHDTGLASYVPPKGEKNGKEDSSQESEKACKESQGRSEWQVC